MKNDVTGGWKLKILGGKHEERKIGEEENMKGGMGRNMDVE